MLKKQDFDTDSAIVAPSTMAVPWQTIIDPGGMNLQDNVVMVDVNGDGNDEPQILSPASAITDPTRHILKRDARAGTNLRLSMGYDQGNKPTTDPVVKVFGRTNGKRWQRIPNLLDQTSVTLLSSSKDEGDGTYEYTAAKRDPHTWDCDGCDEILVGVEVPAAGTNIDQAFLQAKLV
jgi:hypothetical protein